MPTFAVFVSATAASESGRLPTVQEFADMKVFNDQLRAANILLDANGFVSSTKAGARISFNADGPQAPVYGPFGLENLIAGYWFWKLDTIEQAVEWARKIPFTKGERVEIRRVAGKDDFGEELREVLEKEEGEGEGK